MRIQAGMTKRFRSSQAPTLIRKTVWPGWACAMLVTSICCGCHDGPLYALKVANPYYSMHEWRKEAPYLGQGADRLGDVQGINDRVADLSPAEQAQVLGRLQSYVADDPSPEIRRLAVLAAAKLADKAAAQAVIEKALDDSVVKVRMEACRGLGKLGTDDAARMLVATLGTDTDLDVRHSAIAALEGYKGDVVLEPLRNVLEDRNPATRALAMSSLRGVIGEDLGNDPLQWIAAIDQRRGTTAPNVSPPGPPGMSSPGLGGGNDPPIMAAGYTGTDRK